MSDITENEIIKIIKEEINIVNFDITYGKSIWIDNKDLQNIAKAILDKIKEVESCDGCGRNFAQYVNGGKYCEHCIGEYEDKIYDLKRKESNE